MRHPPWGCVHDNLGSQKEVEWRRVSSTRKKTIGGGWSKLSARNYTQRQALQRKVHIITYTDIKPILYLHFTILDLDFKAKVLTLDKGFLLPKMMIRHVNDLHAAYRIF